MKSRYFAHAVTAAVVLAIVSLVLVSAPNAQQAPARRSTTYATKATPKMADGHPDFTGFWLNGAAGLGDYAGTEEDAIDANLTRLPDGSTIWLYGGAAAGIPNDGKL